VNFVKYNNLKEIGILLDWQDIGANLVFIKHSLEGLFRAQLQVKNKLLGLLEELIELCCELSKDPKKHVDAIPEVHCKEVVTNILLVLQAFSGELDKLTEERVVDIKL